jgi:inosine/xanthosine triphosphatase
MKVIVGSTNPVKVSAARKVFTRVDPHVEIVSVEVESGVSIQPWGDEETQQGAENRARAAVSRDADFGIGFEGGVIDTHLGLMTCAWCAVVDRSGRCGLGGGGHIMLPPAVQEALRAGDELGPAMDRLVGLVDTKKGPGAAGILTGGLTDRQTDYEHMLALALARFRRPDLYEDHTKEKKK